MPSLWKFGVMIFFTAVDNSRMAANAIGVQSVMDRWGGSMAGVARAARRLGGTHLAPGGGWSHPASESCAVAIGSAARVFLSIPLWRCVPIAFFKCGKSKLGVYGGVDVSRISGRLWLPVAVITYHRRMPRGGAEVLWVSPLSGLRGSGLPDETDGRSSIGLITMALSA